MSLRGAETVLHSFGGKPDGESPVTALTYVNGTLYGTTLSGGSSGAGTVYGIGTTGKEKVLHGFAGGTDGSAPQAALIDAHGTLYGTTATGGSGFGTVYALSP